MKDWVKEKLEQIEALYPPEKVEKRRERWRALWEGKPKTDRRPFVCTYYHEPYCPAPDFETRLREGLDEIIVRASIDDDYIPSLFTGCRQSTIPSMFGAEEIFLENNDVTCRKLIKSPADVAALPRHSMAGGTVARMWLDMEEYFLTETEGKLPIHVTDMQGPFDVAGQLWGYEELFVCAYEKPEIYHELIQKLTDAFIDFWNAQKALLGERFVPTHLFAWDWVPEDFGGSMSVDSLAMISKPFYDEFYRPYIEQIAKRLGKLAVHSCGDFSAVVKSLCKTKGIVAVNAGQMSLRSLFDAGMTPDTLAITFTHYEQIDDLFEVCKQFGARVVIGLGWVWNFQKPFAEWDSEDFGRLKAIERHMHQKLSEI